MTRPDAKIILPDLAPFHGRDPLVRHAEKLLKHRRLVTLFGPPGVGKTRLGARLAMRVREAGNPAAYAYFVDLRPSADSSEDLYLDLARGLAIRYQDSVRPSVFRDHFEKLELTHVLLVLDNCDHRIHQLRESLPGLLTDVPVLRIVATSRQELALEPESVLPVPPLDLAAAVKMYQEARQMAGAGVTDDTQAVQKLCEQLDGLPISIWLAARYAANTMSIAQLTQRIRQGSERFRLLAAPSAGAASQHASLQEVVELSYELCSADERRLWRRTAVFARGFELDAATAVASGAGLDPAEVEARCNELVSKSILKVDDTSSGSTTRYVMIDTLRDFGLRMLTDAGEIEAVRRLHHDYFAGAVERAAATWFETDEIQAMTRVYRNLDDILAAVECLIAAKDLRGAQVLLLNLVRTRTLHFFGFLDVVAQYLRRVIELAESQLAENHADSDDAAAGLLAMTYAARGWVVVTQGHATEALKMAAKAEDLLLRHGVGITAPILFALGSIMTLALGHREAIGLLSAARWMAPAAPGNGGDRHMMFMMLVMAAGLSGEPALAVAYSLEYLAEAEQSRGPWSIAWALWCAALAALSNGETTRAAEHMDRCLRIEQELDDEWGIIWSIELCAWIWAEDLDAAADPQQAAIRIAWMFGASSTRRNAFGTSLAGMPAFASRRAQAADRVAAVLGNGDAEKGREELARVSAIGSRRPTDALRVALGDPIPSRRPVAATNGLSPRELDVVRLVATGATDREIAGQLGISVNTVITHGQGARAKLNIRTRAGLMKWWLTSHPDDQA